MQNYTNSGNPSNGLNKQFAARGEVKGKSELERIVSEYQQRFGISLENLAHFATVREIVLARNSVFHGDGSPSKDYMEKTSARFLDEVGQINLTSELLNTSIAELREFLLALSVALKDADRAEKAAAQEKVPAKLDETLLKTLVRGYYFNEAMAFYQQYYRPLVETYPPARETLKDTSRHEDRPPTWVPLVFHCTTEDYIEGIFNDGALTSEKGVVCFTEVPIGELDRMKFRKSPDKHQVAIGFPRRYLERLGLASVLYLKHNPTLRRAWEQIESKKDCEDILSAMNVLEPFADKKGDVSPFQEVRVPDLSMWHRRCEF